MGLTVDQFYDMTAREFRAAAKGYAERTEQEGRERWEQARMVAYYAAAPHLRKSKTMMSLIPLPWDRNPLAEKFGPGERPTPEQIEQMFARLDKIKKWQDKPLALS